MLPAHATPMKIRTRGRAVDEARALLGVPASYSAADVTGALRRAADRPAAKEAHDTLLRALKRKRNIVIVSEDEDDPQPPRRITPTLVQVRPDRMFLLFWRLRFQQ